MNDLFGSNMFLGGGGFLRLFSRLVIDLSFATIVIWFVYYRLYRNREYVFTYFVFNVITFCLCLLLRHVPVELGFALGVFAVVGIHRYRAEGFEMRDLTYLFIVVGLGILNAVANEHVGVMELLTVQGVIVGLTAALELSPFNRTQRSTPMYYDNLDLLRPGNEAALHADVAGRTGLNVVRVEVVRFDMLRDAAEVTVVYENPPR